MAIEIERSAKSVGRLTQILTLYQGCTAIDRVLYLGEPKITRRVTRQAGRLAMSELVLTGPIGEPRIDARHDVLPEILELLSLGEREEVSASQPEPLSDAESLLVDEPVPEPLTPEPTPPPIRRPVPTGPPQVERW